MRTQYRGRATKAILGLASGIAFSALVTSSSAFAQTSLEECAGIESSIRRLQCYDRIMGSGPQQSLPVSRLPRNNSDTPANPEVSGTVQNVERAGDNFGLELKRDNSPDEDSRTYRVVAARHNNFTGWTIEFEGEGTWHQVGTDDYDIEVGESYTIKRATLNSFFLSNSKNNRKMRITRLE